MPVETSKTEGELTKEAPFFIGASPAKVLSKFHHPAFFPELSPTTTTEKYSSLLSDTSTGMGRGVSQAQLLSELQKGYGNRYTERVIAEYREKSKEDLEGKEEPTEAKETEKVTVPKEAKKPPTLEPEVKETPSVKSPPTVTTKESVPGVKAPSPEKPEPIAEKSLKTKPSAALREAPSEAITEGPEVEAKGKKPSVVTAPKAPPVEKAVKKTPPGKVAGGVPAAAATGAPGVKGDEETRSPASPEQDPAFQAVKQKSKREARKQKRHEPAKTKAAAAQTAAKGPPKEVENTAKGQQVGKMEQQKAKAFDRKAFKAALLKRIKEITPKNIKEADDFKSSGKAKAIKGEVVGKVQKSKENSQGDIKKTTAETPDQTGIKPKEVKAMPPTQVGPPPMGLRASRAAPKQKTESEVSLKKSSQSLDQQMVDGDVTEQQLKDSNEPEFTSAVDSKHHAQKDAVEAPVAYREEEQTILAGSKTEATESAGIHTHTMHTQRGKLLASVVKKQETTKTTDETTRSKISDNIQKIYDKTKKAVEDGLKKLDGQVKKIFDEGAEKARAAFEDYVARRMRAYKKKRYSGVIGKGRWLKDKFCDLPKYVNTFYVTGRNLYIDAMNKVIGNIATAVETGLNDAKKTIAKGRKSITDYVDSLQKDQKKIGKDAAEKIDSDFDSLEQKVDDKQTQLVDSLARKYVDNLNKVDERIKKMKEANKGLVTKAKDAVKGVINTIRKLKNMLLNVLARVASVIGTIIKAPIRFLGNLVRGVGQGLKNFKNNIWTHLKKGLMGWLFGALEGAGIKLPATFDIKGIISIVLQVLGLTYANFRARAVRILGEPMVKRLEQVAEIFRIVITKGAIGLWNWIKEKLTAIKETVWDGIMSFVKERIIVAGITWLIGLLNPAAAFIKACKMIYDIVMFFVNRGKQILALVNAVIDSVAAIASGSLAVAATAVENALSKALPVAISFLASLLGLGGISQKIRKIIERVQRPVNKAIDWVINKAVKMVQAVGGLFGKGKKEEAVAETKDPKHDAKVASGLAAIDREEKKYLKEGKIEREDAEKVAAKVKSKHRIFKSIKVVDGGESWDYDYVASPGNKKKGEQKKSGRDGSKKKPYLITWFKRPLRQYITILLAKTRVGKRMSHAALMKLKAKGKATEYKPTQRKASPGGEDTIGVTKDNQVKKGMIVGPPASGRSDTEKNRFNRLIEAYGYDRSEEPTDGDHVVELQVSGKDDFRNLWPLNSSENRRSGGKLLHHKIETKDGKQKKIKSLTGKFFEIKDFDY